MSFIMQVCRGKGHTWRKGRIVIDCEFAGTSSEMGQKVNEPWAKVSLHGYRTPHSHPKDSTPDSQGLHASRELQPCYLPLTENFCIPAPGLSISPIGFCTSLMWSCLQQVWSWEKESACTSEEWKYLCCCPAI